MKDLNLGSNPYLQGNYEIMAVRRPSNEQEMGSGSRGPSGPASPIITSPIHSPLYCHGGVGDGKQATWNSFTLLIV